MSTPPLEQPPTPPGPISTEYSPSNESPPGSLTIPNSTPPAQPSVPLAPHLLLLPPVSSSTPNSPQISRHSSGKIMGGMKKFLPGMKRPLSAVPLPPPQAPAAQSTSGPEDTLEPLDNHNKALFSRVLNPMNKFRGFRRTKRRTDKQYHSDDGYTSDPGLLRDVNALRTQGSPDSADDEDETDGDHDSNVTGVLLEQKLKEQRELREGEGEDETYQESQTKFMQGMVDTVQKRQRMQFPSIHVKSKPSSEQHRKKIEAQLGEEPGWNYRPGIKGKIGGGLRGIGSIGLSGLKGIGRLSTAGTRFRKHKRFPVGEGIPPDGEEAMEEEDDDDDDDTNIPEDDIIVQDSLQEDFHVGEFHDPDLSITALKEGMESVRETWVQDQQKLREEVEEGKVQISALEDQLQMLFDKLEQEKERAERLEGQVNDIMDLHQHEVGELRTQLAQMDNLTMSKNQDLEDTMEECQSKLDRLDVFVHQLIDTGAKRAHNPVRRPVAGVLTFLLNMIAFILATTEKVTTILCPHTQSRWTQLRLGVILLVLVVVVLYFVYR